MACTDAVETEIDRHYSEQLAELGDEDPELAADIAEFQAEELEHRETAREHGAQDADRLPPAACDDPGVLPGSNRIVEADMTEPERRFDRFS